MKRWISDCWKFCKTFGFSHFTVEWPDYELVFYKMDTNAFGRKKPPSLRPFNALEYIPKTKVRLQWERLQERFDNLS